MATEKFTLESGASLTVTSSSIEDADNLMSALAKCAKGLPLANDILSQDVTVLKDFFVEAVSNEEVKRLIWKCAQRAVYENHKVTADLFDDPTIGDQARRDLFEIRFKIVEVNCKPFFASIFSKLKARLANAADSQKPQ